MMMSVFERAKLGGFVRCDETDYDYALGVLPPERRFEHGAGFAMGEPWDSWRWFCFWAFDGVYWCALLAIGEAAAVTWIDENGATYDGAACAGVS
jgi:hypothetical protein